MRHCSFINFIFSIVNIGIFNKNDTILQLASCTFDAHLFEILGSLLCSATFIMLHPQGNIVGKIPSAKATTASVLERAQKLSHQPRAAVYRIAAPMGSVLGIVGFTLAIVSPTIASAATIEEVAHCRAIPQLAERLSCFKSLKPGPRPKTDNVAPGKKQDAGSSKVKDAARAKARQAAPAKNKRHRRIRKRQLNRMQVRL